MKNILIVLAIALMPFCYGANFAIIKDSKVINVIEADATNANSIAVGLGAVAIQSNTAGIGMIYNSDGTFSPAPAVEESAVAAALKQALAGEIERLNAAYPGLNLVAVNIKNADGTITKADTIITAIPKLFAANVTKADSNYLFTLYGAIKEAQR